MTLNKEQDPIDRLIAESEVSIKRLEQLSKKLDEPKGPWRDRVVSHVRKNSNTFVNLALSGFVLAIALSRLNDKYSQQAETEDYETKLNFMQHQIDMADILARETRKAISTRTQKISKEMKEALDNFTAARVGSVDGKEEGIGRPLISKKS